MKRDRIRIDLPPFELPMPLLVHRDFEKDQAALSQWFDDVHTKVALNILVLAEATGADPDELMKVAYWLVELVPPKLPSRGRRRKPPFDVLLRVAVAYREGAQTLGMACGLAGVDPKTFRRAKKECLPVWKMFLEFGKRKYLKELDQKGKK
jgi:hypothetical protein